MKFGSRGMINSNGSSNVVLISIFSPFFSFKIDNETDRDKFRTDGI
jgi:hypothetical protein